MSIAAHFEPLAASTGRTRAARRRLLLEAAGTTAAGEFAEVLVHNISATGVLLESRTPIAHGELIEIDLPEVGPIAAQVVWANETQFGCRFDNPLPAPALTAIALRDQPVEQARPRLEESFPARLHRLRKERGLTLSAIGDALGVSKPTVWAWEQGRARPTGQHLAALAALFAMAQDDLVSGRDADGIGELLAQVRIRVAAAFAVEPAKVRISIDL
jgi:transcriptional regulator with XRE-family HTH domain